MDLVSGPLRLLFVGRLVQEKGILTLIAAAGKLGCPVHLRVLGVGPLEKLLATQASRYPDLILSAEGFATANQVSQAMVWSHAVVVTSEPHSYWSEQWGRVAVEAMLSGRPTVVSDSGELPNIVLEPDPIFPAGDVAALTSILCKLEGNPYSMMDLGARLRTSADRFSPRKLALEINAFWDLVHSDSLRNCWAESRLQKCSSSHRVLSRGVC